MKRRHATVLALLAVLGIVLFVVRRRREASRSSSSASGLRARETRVDVAREPPTKPANRKPPPPRFAAAPSKWLQDRTGWNFHPYGYKREEREEPWATAMEAALRRHFDPALLAELGLARVELLELTCHSTMCKISYRFPDEVLGVLAARDLPPDETLFPIHERLGPFAPRSTRFAPDETLLVGDERYTSRSLLIGFTQDTADPARHEQWARQRRPTPEQIERFREGWHRYQARQAARAQRRDGG